MSRPQPPDRRMAALRRALVAFAALGVGFMVFSAVVANGNLRTIDGQVSETMTRTWLEPLRPLAQAVALLGGVEVTTLVAILLMAYIWRRGFHAEAWALLALPLATAAELLYKHLVYQPAPGRSVSHPDGPSLARLLPDATGAGSYPSGHVIRTVLVYGLLAFVVMRMAERPVVRRIAAPLAVLLCVAMAIDRLYLNVHWESDVIGGALLGALALAAAILWLDRPRAVILR